MRSDEIKKGKKPDAERQLPVDQQPQRNWTNAILYGAAAIGCILMGRKVGSLLKGAVDETRE